MYERSNLTEGVLKMMITDKMVLAGAVRHFEMEGDGACWGKMKNPRAKKLRLDRMRRSLEEAIMVSEEDNLTGERL